MRIAVPSGPATVAATVAWAGIRRRLRSSGTATEAAIAADRQPPAVQAARPGAAAVALAAGSGRKARRV